jgi:hypothetical protein
LLAGLLAIWGWSHMEWLWWFPAMLMVAAMLEPLSPFPLRSRFGPLVYIDLLTVGVAMVAVVRSIGLGLPLLPRTALDRWVLAMLALTALMLCWPGLQRPSFSELKQLVVCGVVFYATATVASRPRGSRWVWIAFPLASALLGLHGLWTLTQPSGTLAYQSHLADQVWGSHQGAFALLVVALPVSVGLALSAGRGSARMAWGIASVLGVSGLGLHLAMTGVMNGRPGWGNAASPFALARAAATCVTMLMVAVMAWRVREARVHEGPRWLAITLAFTVRGLLELAIPPLSGPTTGLLAIGAGLVVGTLRADRRAMRSGRSIGPLQGEAAA